jgi:shikimate kinase
MPLVSAPRQNIALIGFIGSGKSSIGRLIAGRLGFIFVDTDALVTQRAGLEIATGGGIVLRERNHELLRELGLVVLLTANEEVIYERVSRNTKRPLLQTENPRETLSRLQAARDPLYAAAAQWTLGC